MLIVRVTRWSSAVFVTSPTGMSLPGPVTWLTPYGLPSTNFEPSV